MNTPGQTEQRSLINKLCSVMAAVERIPKNGYNSFHNYKYVTEADLADAIRAELSQRRVFIFPSVIHHTRTPLEVVSAKGTRHTQLTEIEVKWTFVDGDSGEERSIVVSGVGEDSVDKGFYKAFTGSEKYMLMKSFLVPTGDDPEAESKTDQSGAAERQKELRDRKGAEAQAKLAAQTNTHHIDLVPHQDGLLALTGPGLPILQAEGLSAQVVEVNPEDCRPMVTWLDVMKAWIVDEADVRALTGYAKFHGVEVRVPTSDKAGPGGPTGATASSPRSTDKAAPPPNPNEFRLRGAKRKSGTKLDKVTGATKAWKFLEVDWAGHATTLACWHESMWPLIEDNIGRHVEFVGKGGKTIEAIATIEGVPYEQIDGAWVPALQQELR